MKTDEAQAEGQVDNLAEGMVDITGLTDEQIGERIESDAAFAKAYATGKVVTRDAAPAPAADAEPAQEEEADTGDPGDTPPQAETPAKPKDDKAAPKPAEAPAPKTFTVKDDELPEGYNTPGKAFKTLKEQKAFIAKQNDLLKQKDEQYQEIVSKLQAAEAARAPAAQPAAQPAEDEEIDDAKIYDPQWMKAQLKELNRLKKEMVEIKETSRQALQETQEAKVISKTLQELKAFQKQNPALMTPRPLDEIDQDYKDFVDKIAVLTGTTADANKALTQVNVFLSDEGEAGKALRAEAETAGVQPPEGLDTYLKILRIREMAQRSSMIDPSTGKPRPFTLEESFRLNYPDIYSQRQQPVPAAAPAQAPETPQRKPKPTQAELAAFAARQAQQAATDIPPSISGQSVTIDDLSEAQVDALMNLTPAQLRANPTKKKLLDAVYVRMGMEPLKLDGVTR